MLVGVIRPEPHSNLLTEQVIALEKAGCERIHVVGQDADLESLRQRLRPADILMTTGPDHDVREIILH